MTLLRLHGLRNGYAIVATLKDFWLTLTYTGWFSLIGISTLSAFSNMTLLDGWHERHPTCEKSC